MTSAIPVCDNPDPAVGEGKSGARATAVTICGFMSQAKLRSRWLKNLQSKDVP